MCKYCEEPTKNIRLHRQATDSNVSECFIHKAADGAAIFLRDSNEYVYIDIEYCPFCGRKL